MPDAPTPPKAFICHATEDKHRFVIAFAKALRENGVDAWLDDWEMLPGDHLVDKVFEGIKEASAFIVILSATSVAKPWVREEMNAAFVKRLSGECRIIPVVLDDCEVPECLQSTLWQRIRTVDAYSDELKRIVNSIFGLSEKPPIGEAPQHTSLSPPPVFSCLDKIDSLVLEALCRESARTNSWGLVTNLYCLDAVADAGVTDDEIRDSLTILDEEGHIEFQRVMGPTYRDTHVSHLRISTGTFDDFAKAYWPQYDTVLSRLIAGLVNEKWRSKSDVDLLDTDDRLQSHLVSVLEESGYIRMERDLGGGYSIWDVSPKLKRLIATNL